MNQGLLREQKLKIQGQASRIQGLGDLFQSVQGCGEKHDDTIEIRLIRHISADPLFFFFSRRRILHIVEQMLVDRGTFFFDMVESPLVCAGSILDVGAISIARR